MKLSVDRSRVALCGVLCSVVLLGSQLAPPALAQTTTTQTSMLVFPIFDIFGSNQTKIRITNHGNGVLLVRLTFVCQSPGASLSAQVCTAFNEWVFFTAHETRVFDVATELTALGGLCPTGQGFIVALTGLPCAPSGLACPSEQVSGSYQLFYHGVANSGALCGGVPCAPQAMGPNPDVEAGDASAIPAPPAQSFGTPSALSFEVLKTSFAAMPFAPLSAGPGNPDTVSAVELQTNFILLDPYAVCNAANRITSVPMQVWNWLGVGFTTSTQFVCWERIPVTTIDPRFAFASLGSPYGSVRVPPLPLEGGRPAVLGAVEEVTDVGRTIRAMVVLPVVQP